MAALQVHTLDEFTYRQNLLNFLKLEENRDLARISDVTNSAARDLQPHYDGGKNLAIGYGFDLFVQSFGEIQQRLAQVGVTFANPAAVQTALQQAKQQAQQIIAQFGVNARTTRTQMDALGELPPKFRLPRVTYNRGHHEREDDEDTEAGIHRRVQGIGSDASQGRADSRSGGQGVGAG